MSLVRFHLWAPPFFIGAAILNGFRDILDVNSSCFVFASAGSGKTKTLVDRYVKSLFYGQKPREILCITFTNAAVFEMKSRIASVLRKLYLNQDDFTYTYLSKILGISDVSKGDITRAEELFFMFQDELNSSKILTIHSLCKNILQQFPLESGILPFFEIIDENEARDIIINAKFEIIDQISDDIKSLSELISIYSFEELINNIGGLATKISRIFEFYGSAESYKKYLEKILNVEPLLEFTPEQSEFIELNFKGLNLDEIYLTKSGSLRKKVPLKDFETSLDISEIVYNNHVNTKKNLLIEKTCTFARIAFAILEKYKSLKQSKNLLDFNDVLVYTEYLLSKSSSKEFALSKICSSFKQVMIDEAQDLSIIQWHIVSLICEDILSDPSNNKTLFIVGDIKQSIYRFQGADYELFSKFYEFCKISHEKLGKTFRTFYLNSNYRTLPKILDYVDRTFKGPIASYAFNEQIIRYSEHNPKRNESTGVFESIEFSDDLNELVNHIASQETNDILILSRSRTELTEKLMKLLSERGLKIAPPDRILLNNQLLILDIMAILRLSQNVNDKYSLACILKSPHVFQKPFSNEDLLRIFNGTQHFENLKKFTGYEEKLQSYLNNCHEDCLLESVYFITSNFLNFGDHDSFIIQSFIDCIVYFIERHSNTISDFIKYFEKTNIEISNQTTSRDCIRFSTIHGSKGLEASIVYLFDFEITPNKQKMKYFFQDGYNFIDRKVSNPLFLLKPSKTDSFEECDMLIDAELEEEKKELYRLLYVALTRPRNKLYIVKLP